MIDGTIIRGTTPHHEFELPYAAELVSQIEITYGQKGKPLFTKTKQHCRFENNVVSVDLTQQETFSFIPNKRANVEIRVKNIDGRVIRSEEPIVLRVVDNMSSEVLK